MIHPTHPARSQIGNMDEQTTKPVCFDGRKQRLGPGGEENQAGIRILFTPWSSSNQTVNPPCRLRSKRLPDI